eukprot:3234391-Prymnesium_polylepis.1
MASRMAPMSHPSGSGCPRGGARSEGRPATSSGSSTAHQTGGLYDVIPAARGARRAARGARTRASVSYTHLTLPTICSV